MTRFTMSTCSVLAEVAAFDAAATPVAIGVGVLGLMFGAAIWWTELRQLADRLVGLDLPSSDARARVSRDDCPPHTR